MEYLSGGPIQSWQDCLGGQNLETRLDAASLRSVARSRASRTCAFPKRDYRLRGPHGRGGEFSPGSELRGPLCEDGDNAAEVEVAERDGACGTVLVKLNTQVWIWETNTLLLVGFRRSNGK